MGTEMAGDQAAGYGAKGCSDEAEAGDGERGAERGLQNDHGGDGGPMGFREFEDAGHEEGHGGTDGRAGGVFQRMAVQADRSCGDGLGHGDSYRGILALCPENRFTKSFDLLEGGARPGYFNGGTLSE